MARASAKADEAEALRLGYDGVLEVDAEENRLADDEAAIEREIMSEFDNSDGETEWRVKVKKVNPRTRKQETCFYCSPDELGGLFEKLRADFGPGHYRAYVQKNGQTVRNLGYDIAAPLGVASAQPSQIADIGKVIERQNEQLSAIMAGRAPAQSSADPTALATSMIASMAAMMKEMREVFAPSAAPALAGGVTDQIKTLAALMDLADKMGGDRAGRGEKGIADIVDSLIRSPIAERFADQIGKSSPQMLTAVDSPKTLAPSRLQAQSIPRHDQRSENGNTFVAALDPQLRATIAAQLQFWCGRAAANSDPTLYADVALDTTDRAIIGAVLLRDDLREIAAALHPPSIQFWPWISRLIDEIRSVLTEDADASDNVQSFAGVEGRGKMSDAPAPDDSPPRPDDSHGDAERPIGDGGDARSHDDARPKRKTKPAHPPKS